MSLVLRVSNSADPELTLRQRQTKTISCHGNAEKNIFPNIRYFKLFFIDATGIKVDYTSDLISVAILFGLNHIMTGLFVNVTLNDVLLALTYSAFGSKITVQVTYK